MPGVVMYAAGSELIGIGHLARASAVADALARYADVHLILEADPGVAAGFTGGRGTIAIAESADHARSLLELNATRSQVLVSDALGFGDLERDSMTALGYSCRIHLTDDGIGAYRPDLVVMTDATPDFAEIPAGISIVAGPGFHPIRQSIRSLRPAVPSNPATPHVVVALGGADPGRCTERLIDQLESSGHEFQVTVVAGPAVRGARLRSLEAQSARIEVISDGDRLPQLLATASVVVTLGGLTTYESMCLGTPVAALRWGHLTPVVDRLVDAGLVVGLDESDASAALDDLVADPARLKALSELGHRTIDGIGAARTAGAIAAFTGIVP